MFIIQTAIRLGLVYSFVALALFVSYRILNIADLSTDGVFVFAMAISARLALEGHPILGIFIAVIASSFLGLFFSFLQTKCGIPSILAGIILNTGLYTVNLAIMDFHASNAILKSETIFTLFKKMNIGGSFYSIILISFIAIFVIIGIYFFLSSKTGLFIRATGDNSKMASAYGINPDLTISLGLMLASSLTGLSGALVSQLQKGADINAGNGIVTIGLATLIIGEVLVQGKKSISRNIAACFVGSIVYRCIYAILLQTRILSVEYLKLVTACIVALAISVPYFKDHIKKEGKRYARNKTNE